MNHVLAITTKGEQVAKNRVGILQKQFPDAKFEIQDHERKHQILLMDVPTGVPVAKLQQMQDIARGHWAPPQEVDVSGDAGATAGITQGGAIQSGEAGGPSGNTAPAT